jgi:hypothetical protein
MQVSFQRAPACILPSKLVGLGMPSKKRRPPGYSGVLLEPMTLYRPPGGMQLRLTAEEAQFRNYAQYVQRMDALFAHYNINQEQPDAYERLCMKLVKDHIQGFSFRDPTSKGVGAPRTTSIKQRRYLRAAVEKLTSSGMTVREACNRLAKTGVFKSRGRPLKAETLRSQYGESVAAKKGTEKKRGA